MCAIMNVRRASCLAALTGLLLALLSVAAVVVVNARRQALPELTPSRFDDAWARWQSQAPPDYDIEVVVAGRQPATYAVQVRQGQVQQATRNGNPLQQPRTWGTWSVPGMFGTIETDLRNQNEITPLPADTHRPQLILRAEFAPKWGYPARYQRLELVTQNEVSWQVTRFTIPQDAVERL